MNILIIFIIIFRLIIVLVLIFFVSNIFVFVFKILKIEDYLVVRSLGTTILISITAGTVCTYLGHVLFGAPVTPDTVVCTMIGTGILSGISDEAELSRMNNAKPEILRTDAERTEIEWQKFKAEQTVIFTRRLIFL